MSDVEVAFAQALNQHDAKALRAAFDDANRLAGADAAYDRTALDRWRKGGLPTREHFVECLAEQLDDPALLIAWGEARSQKPARADAQAVITRFKGLDKHSQRHVLDELSAVADEQSDTRSDYSLRIQLDDSEIPGMLRCSVSSDWTGPIPENALVTITSPEGGWVQSFEEERCIFGEVVDRPQEELEAAMLASSFGPPLLMVTYPDNSPARTFMAIERDTGHYSFDNGPSERARVKLRVSYPYPFETPSFVVRFRGYRIAAPAELTLVLNSARAHSPRAHAFSKNYRDWYGGTAFSDTEFIVELGEEGETLAANGGVFFHWSTTDRTADTHSGCAPG